MALKDILAAIKKEAELRIADASNAHEKRLAELHAAYKSRIAAKKDEIDAATAARKDRMKSRVETHVAVDRRNTVLAKKREMLDAVYDAVLEDLLKLPKAETEQLLGRCLAGITEKGVIHPAPAHAEILKKLAADRFDIGTPADIRGGFIFESSTKEESFSYDRLVQDVLRPATEVDTAQKLFA
ncbi:MAG TPA: hypothetical protein VHA78_00900 [Candidatus Peribacteraceae bacterium]|nr:hypothetical protein [Candidatus Peribacteraceae bacterium]